MENVIEIQKFTKLYGRQKAIDNIDIVVKQGEFFGFIGPNGAGKSTTINAMLNYIFPTEGKIKIFGLDSIKDSVQIKKQVGFVPSEVFYYDNMTVREILDYSLSFYGIKDKSKLNKYVKLLDIDTGKKIEDLSLGNKKKVAIAQSLIHSPKLLILDEPTNGLDPLMQQVLFDILDELKKEGTTIFMSSHVLSEVQKYCSRVALIKHGKIIKQGSIEELIPNFKNIHLKTTETEKLIEYLDKKIDKNHIINNGDNLTFPYSGDINELIKFLAKIEIEDIIIETPTLEELFIKFYDNIEGV